MSLAAQVCHAYSNLCVLTYMYNLQFYIITGRVVAKAFEFYGSTDTTETQRFVEMFDKFFDCLNVRNLDEHRLNDI